MRNIGKQFFYAASSILPLSFLKKTSQVSTLLPYHHTVSDRELLHIKHLYAFKSISQFKSDLDYLLKNFVPISPEQLVEKVNRDEQKRDNTFLLTFDDGLRECEEIIAPILKEKGVPAIFFINPAFIDNKELFYRFKISLVIEKINKCRFNSLLIQKCFEVFGSEGINEVEVLVLRIKKIKQDEMKNLDYLAELLEISYNDFLTKEHPYLNFEQVLKIEKMGFTIGAHSWDHPYYSLLSLEQQLLQTTSSLAFVKNNFNQKNTFFSFPHEDISISQTFFDEFLKSDVQCDLFFGTQNQIIERGNKILHRFNAERPWIKINNNISSILLLMIVRLLLNRNDFNRLN